MEIKLPSGDFTPKSILLSEIDIYQGYLNNEIYRACSNFEDYVDYPIKEGNYIILAFNGIILLDEDSLVVIDKATLAAESFNVPIELTEYTMLMEIK